jgi:hypothetical protein
MAIEAPPHAQRFHLHHNVGFGDISMTMFAVDSSSQVGTVIEVRIVRQFVHPNPLDRNLRRHTLPNRQQSDIFRADDTMAVHACLCRGDVCEKRNLDLEVAIPAVHAKVACVEFVVEGNRLNGAISDVCVTG